MANIDEKYKKSYVPFKLNNVTVWWAHVHKPDTAFGNNKYSIEIRLDDDIAAKMKAMGFKIVEKIDKKTGDPIKNILRAKKEAMTKAGKVQEKPSVVDRDGKTPFTKNIGNGSVCNLKLTAKAWQIRGEWQLSCYLEAVQVVKLVEYEESGFEDVSGDSTPF